MYISLLCVIQHQSSTFPIPYFNLQMMTQITFAMQYKGHSCADTKKSWHCPCRYRYGYCGTTGSVLILLLMMYTGRYWKATQFQVYVYYVQPLILLG